MKKDFVSHKYLLLSDIFVEKPLLRDWEKWQREIFLFYIYQLNQKLDNVSLNRINQLLIIIIVIKIYMTFF